MVAGPWSKTTCKPTWQTSHFMNLQSLCGRCGPCFYSECGKLSLPPSWFFAKMDVLVTMATRVPAFLQPWPLSCLLPRRMTTTITRRRWCPFGGQSAGVCPYWMNARLCDGFCSQAKTCEQTSGILRNQGLCCCYWAEIQR